MQKIKYKFVETTGCTAFDFTVNDKSLSDIPQNDQDQILEYLLLKIKEGIKDNTIQLENVVEMFQYDDYEHDDHVCGQCGDTVSTTTWNI
jgi:hypothetical protein